MSGVLFFSPEGGVGALCGVDGMHVAARNQWFHLLNMVQCWGVACLEMLLLGVLLAYMEVVVVLCLASLGCVSEPYALQTVGELLWWYVSVKHGLD
jgi:hypothetical protein